MLSKPWRIFAAVFVCLALLTVPVASAGDLAGRVPAGAVAIAAKIDPAYMHRVIENLTAIGSSPVGFRTAGTPEDLATATYITDRMREIGLQDVSLETVPVDAWRFRDAWVRVTQGGTTVTFPAASHGGVMPTPPDGITGPIVYAGLGTLKDYERLKAQGVDVHGKLVLAYWDSSEVWTNHMAYEAKAQGAVGLLVAGIPGGSYYNGEGALGGFDATCDPVLCATFVTISQKAAAQILDLLKPGPVTGTMRLDVEVQEGATGWNTYGVIPGAKHPDQVIVFSAHHDAWFFGAVDDTSGVAAILALAKAIKESGYTPDRTLVFSTHTGEEFGINDAYYDWLQGAWWQINYAHTEWQASAVAFMNYEGMGFAGRPLHVNVAQELRTMLTRELGRATTDGLLPYGWALAEVYSWNELWTFAAAGVPGFTFHTIGGDYTSNIYHTQLDTIDKVDFDYLRDVVALTARVFVRLDNSPLAQYDFTRRSQHLLGNLDTTAMTALGGDANRVLSAAKALDKAAQALEGVKPTLKGAKAEAALALYRRAIQRSLQEFTALSVWDFTIYPHQQIENDALHLGYSADKLAGGEVQGGLRELEWFVGQMWYAPRLSKEPFAHEMSHHAPGYSRLTWGGQGHLAPYLDLWDQYHSVKAKAAMGDMDFSLEIAALLSARAQEIQLYQERLDHMVQVMGELTSLLQEATALAG